MKVVSITQTCNACPSQWEGTLDDGRMVYVRYRWGGLSIRVSNLPTKKVMEAVDGEEIFYKDIGDGLDGILEYSKLVEITEGVIDWPKQ